MAHQAFFSPPTAPGDPARIKISPLDGALYTASGDSRIWKQLVTAGDFVSLGFPLGYYFSVIGIGPTGNMYSHYSGTSDVIQIYDGGTYSTLYHNYGASCTGVTVAPNNDVYACYSSGLSAIGIVFSAGGTGTWTVLDTSLGWSGIAASVTGDIYASKGAQIFRQAGGVGTFDLFYTAGFTIGSLAISSLNNLYFFNAASSNKYYKMIGCGGSPLELLAPSTSTWLSAEDRLDGSFYISGTPGIKCLIPGDSFSTIYMSPSEGNLWPHNTVASAALNPTTLIFNYARRGTIIDSTDNIYVIDAVTEAPSASPSFNLYGATLRGYHGDKSDSLGLQNGSIGGNTSIIQDLVITGGTGVITGLSIVNCDMTRTTGSINAATMSDCNIVGTTANVGGINLLDCNVTLSGGHINADIIRGGSFNTNKRTDYFVNFYRELSGAKITMTDPLAGSGQWSIVVGEFDSYTYPDSKCVNNLIIANTNEASHMGVIFYVYAYDSTLTTLIENNTILVKDGVYLEAYGSYIYNLRFSNNIDVSPRAPTYFDTYMDSPELLNFSHLDNLFQSSDALYYANNGEEITPDISEIFDDPLFLGSGGDPYALQLTSPGRHTGYHYTDSPTTDILGTSRPNPPSRGAYEDLGSSTYTVSYDGNGNTGGIVPTDPNEYEEGDTVTVLANTGGLTKTGYVFANWNTAPDGSGTSYSGGDTFLMGGSDVTLYAQWTAVNYTVSYGGNGSTGGTVPVDSNNYHIGDTVTVLGNTGGLTRTGYSFNNWNTAPDGSGTSYAGGATFLMGSSNVTLYAQWTAINYMVGYDGNGNTGGTAPVDSNNYHIGDTVTVLNNTGGLTKTGYFFANWNTEPDGSGTSYVGSETFLMGSSNVTLYAQWALLTYTVTYNGNGNTGGIVPVDPNEYEAGEPVVVLGNTGSLTKTGYSFNNWNTAPDGSGTSYSGGDTFLIGSSNVTLYAQWTLLNYTVSYDGNGNTGGLPPTDSNLYHAGDTVTVLGNTGSLTRTGYSFNNWNTAPDGSGTSYAGGATFLMGSSNVTLYAQWALLTYTVVYNGNGSTGGATPIDSNLYHVGDIVTVLGNIGSLVRAGYLFNGWNTSSDGSGTSYGGGMTFLMGSSNVTLYAQWEPPTTDKRYWVATSSQNFDTTNWAYVSGGSPGASVPNQNNIAIYDFFSQGDCTCNVPVHIKGLRTVSGFNRIIHQEGYSITVDASDASFSAGFFYGSSAPITINSSLYIGSMDFSSTSNILTLYGQFYSPAGDFIHNDGTFRAMATSTLSRFRPNGALFNDLTIDNDATPAGYRLIDSSSFTESQLVLRGGYLVCGTDGTLNVLGDVYCDQSFGRWSNLLNVQVNFMNSSDGTVQHMFSGGIFPHIYVDKTTSWPVKLIGETTAYIDGDFKILDGTFNTNGVDVQVGAI
jgi:uncharacterized repeat protein (TIGR02543 family)